MSLVIADCHNHILDPVRFAYGADNPFHPKGEELNSAQDFLRLLDANGVSHALLVQPNSGHGPDNRPMLDAIAAGKGRFKGVVIAPSSASRKDLLAWKEQGVVGIAVNPTFHAVDYYRDIGPLFGLLEELGMFLQIQVAGDMLVDLLPVIAGFKGKLLVDHCGRPIPKNGLGQPGFAALLRLADNGRTSVKLSGHVKFSEELYPYADTWPFVHALAEAFTLDNCVWGSDWPCLRARERMPYAKILALTDLIFPDANDRHKILWQTPARLFGFSAIVSA